MPCGTDNNYNKKKPPKKPQPQLEGTACAMAVWTWEESPEKVFLEEVTG